jgi:AcrR family transcriptional regulator
MSQARPRQTLSPRKTPSQARSAFTVQAILDAAARVLAQRSLDGFNTNRVAEVAGVSVGSLYQYFPNKDALTAALIAFEQDRLAQAIEASVEASVKKDMEKGRAQSLRKALSPVVQIAIDHQWGNPVYAAALDHEEKRLPVSAQLQAIQMRLVATVAQLLRWHLPRLNERKAMQLARDCVVICKALIEAEPAQANLKLLKTRVVDWLMSRLEAEQDTRI